jgi:hypothetical protein
VESVDENNYRNVERMPDLVGRLYEIDSELEALFPGRYFTPDGHLMGSLGEVMAAHDYGRELLPASAERQDARTQDGRFGAARPAWPRSPTCRSSSLYTLYRFAAQASPAPNPTVMMYFSGSRSS